MRAGALGLCLVATGCRPEQLGLQPPPSGLAAIDGEAARHVAWALRRVGAEDTGALQSELRTRAQLQGLRPRSSPSGAACFGADTPSLVVWMDASSVDLEGQALAGAGALQLGQALQRPEAGPSAVCVGFSVGPTEGLAALGAPLCVVMGPPRALGVLEPLNGDAQSRHLRIPAGRWPAADQPNDWVHVGRALEQAITAAEALRGATPTPRPPRARRR